MNVGETTFADPEDAAPPASLGFQVTVHPPAFQPVTLESKPPFETMFCALLVAALPKSRQSNAPARIAARTALFTLGACWSSVNRELPEMRKSGRIALSTGNYGMGTRRTTRSSSRTIKHLTKEQLRAFFRAIPRENIRDRLLFNLMYLHALRRGEASILSLDSFQDGMIHVTRLKGGQSLSYDMFPSSCKLLQRYLAIRRDDGCRYLFRGRLRACAPLSGRTIAELFRGYATAAGLPPDLRHSHVLRHSLGTHLANEGFDIADAAEQLGHSDLNSTAIYFQITNRRRAKIHRRMLRSTEIVRS